jgi:hypothetical protein
MLSSAKLKLSASGIILAALLFVPAPLLPPHRLAEAVQSMLGMNWKAAYLLTAIGLHSAFYGSLGLLASITVKRAPTLRGRLLQMVAAPLIVVGLALLIRSLKMGHLPVLANAAVPVIACLLGAGLGLGLLYRAWTATVLVALAAVGVASWGLLAGASAEVSRDTEAQLRRLVSAESGFPLGDERFGALLRAALVPMPGDSVQGKAVQHNRAAILALGIAVGDERLARYASLDPQGDLVREAIRLRKGTTLRGRADWPRHYALSAALAVLENPLVSDAAGLMKEQMDALTHGSGFSFGDLAADRAGVRFAGAATRSEAAAQAMQARLRSGFSVDDFFPPAADLPENLTVEQFRDIYGSVGSQRYWRKIGEIEQRLDRCAGLAGM